MPRDYRKRTGSRAARSASGSSFGWVIFGIFIGVFVAGLLYWKVVVAPRHHHHAAAATVHTQQQPAVTTSEKKNQNTAPAGATPEFDFYTVLPKMQVAPNQAPAATTPARPPVAPPTPPTPTNAAVKTAPAAAPATVTTTAPTTAAPEAVNTATSPVTTTSAPTAPPKPVVNTATPASVEKKAIVPPATAIEKKSQPVKSAPDAAHTRYLLQMGSLKNYAEADRLKAELTIMGFDVYIQPYKSNGQIYNRVVMGPYPSKQAALQQQTQLKKSGANGVLVKIP